MSTSGDPDKGETWPCILLLYLVYLYGLVDAVWELVHVAGGLLEAIWKL